MSRNPCPCCLSKVADENGRCTFEGQCVPRFNRVLGQKCTRKRRHGVPKDMVDAFATKEKAEFNIRLADKGEFYPELEERYFPGGASNDNQD